jgi:2-hydroxychromene-2-carboxylate isomerase
MKIKPWLRTRVTALLTSRVYRQLRRSTAALIRRIKGQAPVVHYFHQVDDPYSDLAVRALPHLVGQYPITLVPHLVSAPDAGAAPEPQRLVEWSLRDAADLARALNLQSPHWQTAPDASAVVQAQAALAGITDPVRFADIVAKQQPAEPDLAASDIPASDLADTALQEGNALRQALGHYLGGMFYFEGEWYWGLDRLPYLEQRLQTLSRNNTVAPFVSRLECSVDETQAVPAHTQQRPVLDLYFSFRSPYSWIALPRVFALARRYNAQLNLRFVLPMVMRGLPIPESKRLYIVSDTKREAERVGLPFGLIADPVGKPTERGLAVLHHAIQAGKGEAFALSFMRGVFAEGISARSDSGLLTLCTRAGITEAQMQAALADASWRSVAEANRGEMFALGIWGVPAFRVNKGSAHWGQDRLWLLEQQLRQATMPAPDAPR